MTKRRIETETSRTAEWTCLSRAASSLESEAHYRSGDFLAPMLVPGLIRKLLAARFGRFLFRRVLAQRGMYEYVIARTKYIDAAFRQALAHGFGQVVLFGAGFDTRALRFQGELGKARVFELDVAVTQTAKMNRYRERKLSVPENLKFVAVDFERESFAAKLEEASFSPAGRTLFVLEGVLMYLQPESVDETFRTIRRIAGTGGRIVFDYVRASVLRGENTQYGEAGAARSVDRVNEGWHFGLDPEKVAAFLSTRGFELKDHKDSAGLEKLYFEAADGRIVGRINGTHCLVTADQTV